jgi:hypothetical protein
MLSTLPRTAHHRLEICPPERRCGPRPWWHRLRAWAAAGWPGPGSDTPDARLANIRHDFADALADLVGDHADELLDRLHAARSLRELWHLRAEVFSLVSLQHSQGEADTRLALLNRHFPARAPRSGFGALEPRDMWP